MPFREAHSCAGKAVYIAETKKVSLSDLTVEDLQTVRSAGTLKQYWHIEVYDIFRFLILSLFVSLFVSSPLFDKDVSSVWDYIRSVEQYSAPGGTAKSSITAQIEHFRTWLQAQKQSP